MSFETGVPLSDLPTARLSITASSISDVTGIPRETVRRKFASLEEKGWVSKNSDGSYLLAVNDGVAAAKLDLSEVDARALDRVARMFRDLEAIILATRARGEDAGAHAHSGQETDQKVGTKS
jgi:DNA-binding IclR family transcriptional regulator